MTSTCPLTERQLHIIAAMSSGKPQKTVAYELHIPVGTVHNDVQRSIAKLQTGNAAGLVAKALRSGWID